MVMVVFQMFYLQIDFMNSKEETVLLIKKHLNLEERRFNIFINKIDENEICYIRVFEEAKYILSLTIIKKDFLRGCGGWLYLSKVEDLLQPLLIKYNFLNSFELDERTLIRPIIHNEQSVKILNQAQETQLNTEEDIEKVAGMMWQYIEAVFIPFWEKYSDLQVVNDEIIDRIPDNQITDYLPSYASFKKMIIMKLCKNTNYEEYKSWLYNGLKKRYEEGRNENYYLLLLDLIEILKLLN